MQAVVLIAVQLSERAFILQPSLDELVLKSLVVKLPAWIISRNVLDCDQSNYSSCIIFSHTFTLESNAKWIG